MIMSLYESDFPVRFGVVLYSSKYIMQLENHSAKEDLDKFEDISDMVIFTFNCSEMYTTSQSSFFRKFYSQVTDVCCSTFQIIRLFTYIKGNHSTQLAFGFLSNV